MTDWITIKEGNKEGQNAGWFKQTLVSKMKKEILIRKRKETGKLIMGERLSNQGVW
jgi:hypothetical protein